MNFKKAVCHLWGHDFNMQSRTFFHLDEDNQSTCTRCGKLKFMSFSHHSVSNDSASKVIYQNYNYMNNRQDFKPETRTLQ
jgi:hypothetical protein